MLKAAPRSEEEAGGGVFKEAAPGDDVGRGGRGRTKVVLGLLALLEALLMALGGVVVVLLFLRKAVPSGEGEAGGGDGFDELVDGRVKPTVLRMDPAELGVEELELGGVTL